MRRVITTIKNTKKTFLRNELQTKYKTLQVKYLQK